MRFKPGFYRGAAICSILSGGTTLLLIFLPKFHGPATSFEHRLQLVQHPLYQIRAWAYLLHPFLVATAALGVAAALRRTATGVVICAFLALLGISGELRGPTLPALMTAWLYPLLQPAARLLIGTWQWRLGAAEDRDSIPG